MSMQIAHINLARGYRGGEHQTELLIRSLATKGVRQVLVAREGETLAERLADADVEIRGCDGLLDAFSATRGADVLHAHEGRGVYAAWLRSMLSATPYVITRRVNNPIGTGFLTRRAYRRAACVASVAADIAKIVENYDDRIRSCVIHSSSSGLPVDPESVTTIRRQFQGKWLIGNVGALDNAQKGQEYIIEVAGQLRDSHPSLQFVLVGGGGDEKMLKEMAEGLQNVAFTGFVDNVGDYLSAFDLFILPSNKEGIGGILLDAMDQSLPVVASRVGSLPEIVRDGENGLLIDARSPEQLRNAILRLYEDTELCRTLGARGREISRDFTADAMGENYLQRYEQAVAAPKIGRLVVQTGHGESVLRFEQIDYLAAARNYVVVYANDREYLVRETLGSVEKRLADGLFERTHRSFIVNVNKIDEIRTIDSKQQICLKNGSIVPLSRGYRHSFRTHLKG